MSAPVARGGAYPSPEMTTATGGPVRKLTPRERADPALIQAAEGFEAMYLDYLMQVMRQTVPKSEMDLENAGTQLFTGMLDSETAARAARQGGVGLADQIIAYLVSEQYNLPSGQEAPGGSHAGRSNKKFGSSDQRNLVPKSE